MRVACRKKVPSPRPLLQLYSTIRPILVRDEALSPLALMRPIAEEPVKKVNIRSDGYRFDDLLTFFEDGAGNGENFLRLGPGEPPVGTVDWDHETREVGSVRDFREFLRCDPPHWWFGVGG